MVTVFPVVVAVDTEAMVVVDKADIVVAAVDTMKDKRETSNAMARAGLTS